MRVGEEVVREERREGVVREVQEGQRFEPRDRLQGVISGLRRWPSGLNHLYIRCRIVSHINGRFCVAWLR